MVSAHESDRSSQALLEDGAQGPCGHLGKHSRCRDGPVGGAKGPWASKEQPLRIPMPS